MALFISYATVVGSKTAREMDDLSGPVKAMAVEKAQLSRQFGKFLGRFSATWAEGPHVRIYSRNYDAKGNKTSEAWHNPDGSVNRQAQFVYDEAGRLLESIRYKPDGSFAGTVVYRYDAKGNKTEETTYKADRTLEKKSAFTYEFDAHGNWTKMTEHTKFETEDDADWAESIYRTITYY